MMKCEAHKNYCLTSSVVVNGLWMRQSMALKW